MASTAVTGQDESSQMASTAVTGQDGDSQMASIAVTGQGEDSDGLHSRYWAGRGFRRPP